jgi:hypothetical protein
LRRRDWRRWSCPAGTKRGSPWRSGNSRCRRRRRRRTRPRDRCSRLGRCRLHDHLRNGHRAWRRRRRSTSTRSSRSGSRGRRGLLGVRLWTFSCRGLGGSRFLGSCPHGQQHGRRQKQREQQAHRCKTVWNTTHDTLRNWRNGIGQRSRRRKGYVATRAADDVRAKARNVSARNQRVRWRSALVLAGGRSMLRHLGVGRNGELEECAKIERHNHRRSWKGCAAMRQSAENTVRFLQRLLCRLVLIAARIGSGPMADDRQSVVGTGFPRNRLAVCQRDQERVKREPESDRGGYPLPQPPLISARSEHQNDLAEPAYTLPGAS